METVIKAVPLKDYKIEIRTSSGVSGIFDVKPYLKGNRIQGTQGDEGIQNSLAPLIAALCGRMSRISVLIRSFGISRTPKVKPNWIRLHKLCCDILEFNGVRPYYSSLLFASPSTLRRILAEYLRMTRGHNGAAFLVCRDLSSPTLCRFILAFLVRPLLFL